MISRNNQLVANGRSKNSQLLPATTRGDSPLRQRHNSSSVPQAAPEFVILHDRQVSKPALFLEARPPEKKSLVPIGHLAPARAPIGSPFENPLP